MTARPLFYILLFAALVGAVGYLIVREGTRAAELQELRTWKTQAEQDLNTLSERAQEMDALMTEKIRTEVGRRMVRAQTNAAVQEVAREEPVVRDYLDERIPSRLRDAYLRGARPEPADPRADGTHADRRAVRNDERADGGRVVRDQ